MRVVVVGTGKIACGYLAPLFRDAGWDVVLAGRTPEVVRRVGTYDVRVTGSPAREVRGVRGVLLGSEQFRAAVAEADLVCVCVGVGAVGLVAEPLADALAERETTRPLDVWTVENDDCAGTLTAALWSAARGRPLPPFGVGGGVAHVAVARGSWHDSDRPEFVGDAARRLYVDSTSLTTSFPDLPGVERTTS